MCLHFKPESYVRHNSNTMAINNDVMVHVIKSKDQLPQLRMLDFVILICYILKIQTILMRKNSACVPKKK